jgi:hypothetical protein
MPLYVLKRWHRLVPNPRPTWHLGREIAFIAADDADAIRAVQEQYLEGFSPSDGLATLMNRAGEIIWENPLA